jgi:hypothetical protein
MLSAAQVHVRSKRRFGTMIGCFVYASAMTERALTRKSYRTVGGHRLKSASLDLRVKIRKCRPKHAVQISSAVAIRRKAARLRRSAISARASTGIASRVSLAFWRSTASGGHVESG